mgnify:CR=1 FL=1
MITANEYYKERFGGKVYRVSLNGGMSCPNRDGTIDTRGCIFCSRGGSGDFATPADLSVTEQLRIAKSKIAAKLPKNASDFAGYLAYFQAFTNTYAPVDYLRSLFEAAIEDPEVVGLSVATRPDCISDDCLELLKELSQKKPIYVELGLQTAKESTACFIRRGYPLSVFDDAVQRLDSAGIPVITHVILGLPRETFEDMEATVRHVFSLPVHGIKLQLLHILQYTDLADYYHGHENEFLCSTLPAYLSVLERIIPLIPDKAVVYRLTGDGPKKDLIAPLWSADKKNVLNAVHRCLERSTPCNPKC